MQGLVAGSDIPVNQTFWTDLRLEAARLAKRHRAKK
jgi:hypothetical protein